MGSEMCIRDRTEADESLFWLELHETTLILIDEGGPLDIEISLSGTGSSSHEGRVPLAGVERIWVFTTTV